MKQVSLVYFSPGGTTRKTVRTIAEGMEDASVTSVREYDMLNPANRRTLLHFTGDDLVILGMMTATKLFGLPDEIMACLRGDNTPLAGVVLFGNGYYGPSLKLMKQSCEASGFKMVAAGAFIGQHTYDNDIGRGRPDEKDRIIQRDFGRQIHEKVYGAKDLSFGHKLKTDWPEEGLFSTLKCGIISALPGMSVRLPASWSRKRITGDCIECLACEKRCPVDAIDIEIRSFDYKKCIGCFACGNHCPKNAIVTDNKKLTKSVANVKKYRMKKRREPELFV
ncbi:MAG: 4Fe-4S binding protein [Desulfobacterales bacterium]|nr:4Fe-4S binding protein [Desulfobacterales bacterium]